MGDNIRIKTWMGILSNLISWDGSKADLIEATAIDLTGVTAAAVNGCHIAIGPGCSIENLDCSGTLSIHPTSRVAHITGNYATM